MTGHQLLRMRDSHCKRGRDRLVMDVDVGESDGEQHDLDVSAPEEHGGEVFEDGGGSPGGSPRPRTRGGRIMEPAPPTYEEALTLFVRPRDAGPGGSRGPVASASGGGGGMRALEGPPGRTPSLADDYEMAERLQREELERRTVTRERSASLTSASSDGRNGSVRSETNRRRSTPGDFTPTYRNPVYDQTLRTIPENEEAVSDPTPHSTTSDSSTKTCCYYSCFGFAIFTNRLSPVLRDAWKQGTKQVVDASLPTLSTLSRYILFCTQALIVAACIILSIASTSFKDENMVRSVSLIACLVVNILERFVSWCGCCQSNGKTYNAFSDITRNLLTDIFLYPAVIASIVNTLNTQSYNVVLSLFDDTIYANVSNSDRAVRDDAINFSMNALVLLLFVVMVHLLRLWHLGSIARSLVRGFRNNVSEARSSARVFIIAFFLHVLVQSIVQLLYIFLIGYRVHVESSDPSQPQILGVSVYLFAMMMCGELVPLISVFLFFIATQKWVEEFPIAFFLDHIPSQQLQQQQQFPSVTARNRIEYMFKSLHTFNMRCSSCLFGLIHPLASPLQIVIAMTFFALWVVFVCAYPISGIDSSSLDLSLSRASHGLVGTIGIAVVYGIVGLLSLLSNLLPLIYGFLGLTLLPFWGIFYTCAALSSVCNSKA